MKTTRIQFNAKDFKATRDTISAYFGATYELAIELDKMRKKTKSISEVIKTDEEELIKLGLGQTDGILRSKSDIELSLATNTATYKKLIAPYEALVAKTTDAINAGIALFDNKDSVLYKAYATYVLNPTDDNYNAYADAMATKFVEFGLADATADNVAHYMPNADRALKGTTAVKRGKIIDALSSRNFALAVLRKIHDNNKDAFPCAKFVAYVEKCKNEAKSK